jgi:hypothetical protein
MVLKAFHKYIRIYLYTYISVQKPQKPALIPVKLKKLVLSAVKGFSLTS